MLLVYGKLVTDAEIHLDRIAYRVQTTVSCRLNRVALLVVLDYQARCDAVLLLKMALRNLENVAQVDIMFFKNPVDCFR